jgi:hypothetical protein
VRWQSPARQHDRLGQRTGVRLDQRASASAIISRRASCHDFAPAASKSDGGPPVAAAFGGFRYAPGHKVSRDIGINHILNDQIIAGDGDVYLLNHRHRSRRTTNPKSSAPSASTTRRKTMKTMLLAAAAALSLGIGSAYADSEGGQNNLTQFTQTPGFLAQAPAQNAPAVATAQNGQAVRTFVTQSSHGTWLFPPHQGGGNNG